MDDGLILKFLKKNLWIHLDTDWQSAKEIDLIKLERNEQINNDESVSYKSNSISNVQ